ncbi:hypothetical protein COO60DRAFT_1524729 [Scenedesmus sp. NREL 46B-D3]|nr:hypothetical protein COO60DRAFT_1524729 [Scenedesmus sp. NREL 46B-D3]
MSYDRQVLEQMPAFVREQVPFLTTAKGAIHKTLLQLLKLLAVSDVGFSTLVSRLDELHHWQYYKQMLVYYSFAAVVKEVERTRRTESGECNTSASSAFLLGEAAACAVLARLLSQGSQSPEMAPHRPPLSSPLPLATRLQLPCTCQGLRGSLTSLWRAPRQTGGKC